MHTALAITLASFVLPVLLRGWFWTDRATAGDWTWYFIGQAFVEGAVAAGCLLLLLGLALAARRSFGPTVWEALAFGLLWMGWRAADLVVILTRTTRIWDSSGAKTTWQSSDAFLSDPVRYVSWAIGLTVGGVCLYLTRTKAPDRAAVGRNVSPYSR